VSQRRPACSPQKKTENWLSDELIRRLKFKKKMLGINKSDASGIGRIFETLNEKFKSKAVNEETWIQFDVQRAR
jgi:hypothetical protein